jgi:methylglutaconyl-CoA hydratase
MIKFEVKDKIGILTLNRPEKRNALHPDLIRQMKEKLIELKNNDDVKVLVITGEGKSFCAGADLQYINDLRNFSSIDNEKDSKELGDLYLMLYNYSKPTIAAVNGAALAGGCGLASVCDLIVADENNSKFGYPEVKIGFLAAMVSVFIIRRIGEGAAKQLLLTGGAINGKRAYEIGLVNYLYNNVLKGALEVANSLNKNSLLSMSETKSMINVVSTLSVDEAVKYCIRLNVVSRSSEDFKKGLESFLKK